MTSAARCLCEPGSRYAWSERATHDPRLWGPPRFCHVVCQSEYRFQNAAAFLAKPFDLPVLLERVRACLERTGLRKTGSACGGMLCAGANAASTEPARAYTP